MQKDQDNSDRLIKRHTIREIVDALTKPNTCHGCWMQEECENIGGMPGKVTEQLQGTSPILGIIKAEDNVVK